MRLGERGRRDPLSGSTGRKSFLPETVTQRAERTRSETKSDSNLAKKCRRILRGDGDDDAQDKSLAHIIRVGLTEA